MSNPFFINVNETDSTIISLGINSTGQYIVAVSADGCIYTSNNYGSTFTQIGCGINLNTVFEKNVNKIVSSADGNIFFIVNVYLIYIYFLSKNIY
jgi:hypothetical protein